MAKLDLKVIEGRQIKIQKVRTPSGGPAKSSKTFEMLLRKGAEAIKDRNERRKANCESTVCPPLADLRLVARQENSRMRKRKK
jgi:hypothetical protein